MIVNILMIKKELKDGSPCPKCIQAEELLRKRGLWGKIDEVIWAREGDPQSPGNILAAQKEVDRAPFFLVQDQKEERLYTGVFEFIKKELKKDGPAGEGEGDFSLSQALSDLAGASPAVILQTAQKAFGPGLGLAFSGAEDVVLIDMAVKNALPFSVFCLDTGRLPPQTYRFLERVREHYGIEIEIFSPDPALLEPFVREKGLFSFYADGHSECCRIRKVEPLKRALASRRAWATGQRRDQSPATRGDLPLVMADSGHSPQEGKQRIKFNPLARWSGEMVWDYIRQNDVPYNELHDEGYRSLGCEPCTRASRPGEHERAARWWWEEETRRECGLHKKE